MGSKCSRLLNRLHLLVALMARVCLVMDASAQTPRRSSSKPFQGFLAGQSYRKTDGVLINEDATRTKVVGTLDDSICWPTGERYRLLTPLFSPMASTLFLIPVPGFHRQKTANSLQVASAQHEVGPTAAC